ncbi:hypothetical protein SAMN04487764_0459 [Gillisia sp. Hel1_33_143]|uniref:hypothetical protein n=1 Tax=unclassified Gillisia TaxID=2615025 RepID=UPI00055593FA|nr:MULTISPECIES: hypothetical protein [unclassified Gillisia]SDR73216.1 hypothetical protein SAMN04487764_0459 [Gillisia sp. Hel1_33_143]
MKKTLLLIFLVVLASCNNFETKKISSKQVLDQETKSLNWKEVDEYPAFENCKEITELAAAKRCFETTVANSIYAYLEKQQPIVTEAIDDTLVLYLEISKNGKPTIDSVSVDTTVTNQLPNIKLWLTQSVDSLPKIYPASKRGIPVSSIFKMPILIKAE